MAKIIPFPGMPTEDIACSAVALDKTNKPSILRRVVRGLVSAAWYFLALFWPIIKWLLYFDVVLAIVKMTFHTNPHATFTFFAVLTAVVSIRLFLCYYKPKSYQK